MCIIAYIPKNHTVNSETIEIMFDNNPDGSGLLYTQNKKLRTFKTFDVDQLITKYNDIKQNIDTDIIIHCRIGTHGQKSMENIHPFLINNKVGFVHNGIINLVPIDKKRSDTNMFNELLLKQLPDDFLCNEAIKELISGYIGKSKLVFMDYKQDVCIINEHLGIWDNGIWFSNDGYKDFWYTTPPKITKNKKSNKNKNVIYSDLFDYSYEDLEICPNCETYPLDYGYCKDCGMFFDDIYKKLKWQN